MKLAIFKSRSARMCKWLYNNLRKSPIMYSSKEKQGYKEHKITCQGHILVPQMAASVQVKHQPLQWNIGRVHRYTAPSFVLQIIGLLKDMRYAPRWFSNTPLELAVVPEV